MSVWQSVYSDVGLLLFEVSVQSGGFRNEPLYAIQKSPAFCGCIWPQDLIDSVDNVLSAVFDALGVYFRLQKGSSQSTPPVILPMIGIGDGVKPSRSRCNS